MLTAEIIQGFSSSLLQKTFDGAVNSPPCHKEWWQLACSHSRQIAIAAPRMTAKTTAITHTYTLAAVLFREREYVLIISDTIAQAIQFLGDIKKELQENESLRSLFKVKEFVKETEDDVICRCEDGHCFRISSKGAEQKLRGLKWNNKRPDLVICHQVGTNIYTPETGWIKNQDHPNARNIHAHEAYEIEFEDGTREVVSSDHRYLIEGHGWKFPWQMTINENVVENITDDIMNDILLEEKRLLKGITISQRLSNGLRIGMQRILIMSLLHGKDTISKIMIYCAKKLVPLLVRIQLGRPSTVLRGELVN